MTRYTLRAGDHATTFVIRRTDAGHAVTITKRVGHDRTYVTGWKHVDQFTTTTVRANGKLLAARTAPKGGWYGPCK